MVRSDKGVWFRNARGEDYVLPLNHTDRFQVYRAGSLTLATGDLVRTTAGGKPLNARDIDNGCVATVTGFTPKGDMALSNGMILGKDFGHLASGYYITSWSGQSKTVDRVLVAAGAESFGAANVEQFYVSCTRGREGVKVYTDDKDGLRERIVHSGRRGTATELIEGRLAANTRPKDVTERAMKDRERLRKRVAWRRKHEPVAEAIRDRIAVEGGRQRGDWHERVTRAVDGYGR